MPKWSEKEAFETIPKEQLIELFKMSAQHSILVLISSALSVLLMSTLRMSGVSGKLVGFKTEEGGRA